MKNVPLGLKQKKQRRKSEKHPLEEAIHTYIDTEAWETSDLKKLLRHGPTIRNLEKKKLLGHKLHFKQLNMRDIICRESKGLAAEEQDAVQVYLQTCGWDSLVLNDHGWFLEMKHLWDRV